MISPNSSSIYGGNTLVIEGNGFDNTTNVSIDNVQCVVQEYIINRLICTTGAHLEASNLKLKIR